MIWCSRSVVEQLDDAARRAPRSGPPLKYNIVDKQMLDALVDAPHQGVVMQVQALPVAGLESLDGVDCRIVVVLDQVTDPQNIGGILRLCRVFCVGALVMTRAHAPKETGAMAKVASGALEVVPRCVVPNLAECLRELKARGFWCVGLAEGEAQSIKDVDLRGKIALVMGSEGAGLRKLTKSMCDLRVYIPTSPEFSTLNVTMAAGISLYEVYCAEGKRSL
jgi:23S rRNA (guanosine2251-2'-O)-methyltransferase